MPCRVAFVLMPKYKSRIGMPATIEYHWYNEEDKLIGTLRLKDSGVQWKKNRARKWKTLGVLEFADLIEEHGRVTTK